MVIHYYEFSSIQFKIIQLNLVYLSQFSFALNFRLHGDRQFDFLLIIEQQSSWLIRLLFFFYPQTPFQVL